MSRKAIITFIKNPESGKVKTRLAADIGNEKAVEVYQKLVRHTIDVVQKSGFDTFIYFSSEVPDSFSKPHNAICKVQHGKTLGERMKHAFEEVFEMGYDHVIIIGSDCPEINTDVLENGFNFLEITDACVGPAKDGGYYLLGLNTAHDALFEDKNWSTNSVLTDSIKDIRSLNLDYSQLPVLSDVDTLEDYKQFPAFWV